MSLASRRSSGSSLALLSAWLSLVARSLRVHARARTSLDATIFFGTPVGSSSVLTREALRSARDQGYSQTPNNPLASASSRHGWPDPPKRASAHRLLLIESGYDERASSTAPTANGTWEAAKSAVASEGPNAQSTTPNMRHATLVGLWGRVMRS